GARGVKTSDIIDEINEFMHKHLFAETGDVCPECGKKLGIKLSKFGPFIGCENYPNCKYTKQLNKNEKPVDATESSVQRNISDAVELGDGIEFRVGKFGPYVTDGAKNVAAKQYTAETITLEIARELLTNAGKKSEPVKIGENPETKKMIFFYPTGRYGAYISSNRVNVSVKEMPDLETAIQLINNKTKKK
ncbi:MAG: topoisomerase C-terminal repeat-containing protein, partial [Alphaproteobacteria bacterium]